MKTTSFYMSFEDITEAESVDIINDINIKIAELNASYEDKVVLQIPLKWKDNSVDLYFKLDDVQNITESEDFKMDSFLKFVNMDKIHIYNSIYMETYGS